MWAVITVAAVPVALIVIAMGLERLEAHLIGPPDHTHTAAGHGRSAAPTWPRDNSPAAGRRGVSTPSGTREHEPATVPFAAVLVRTPRRLPR